MTTYQDIRSSRKLVWAGIAIGYALALTIALLNLIGGEGTPLTALAFFAMVAIPPSMAAFALDRRPALLTAASMAALVQGFVLLSSVVGLVEFIPAILWTLAGQKRPRQPVAPGWATWARPLLAAATVLPLIVMFIHLDPRCTVTSADGTLISSSIDENAPTGWRLELGSSASSSTGTDGLTRSCTSDTVQHWEAALSVAVSVVITTSIYRRWPMTAQPPSAGRRREEQSNATAVDRST